MVGHTEVIQKRPEFRAGGERHWWAPLVGAIIVPGGSPAADAIILGGWSANKKRAIPLGDFWIARHSAAIGLKPSAKTN
jgi:hypothetical protein